MGQFGCLFGFVWDCLGLFGCLFLIVRDSLGACF